MTNIESRIGAARQIAARLTERNADVASATKKRDVCLYKFFEAILKLDKSLRNIGKPKDVRMALKARYGTNMPTNIDPGMFAIKLTYPSLDSRARSKYAAALKFVRRKKKPGQSVRSFMQAHGGINGCVTEEKKSRPPKHKLGTLRKK
jgi:hypothetical protein